MHPPRSAIAAVLFVLAPLAPATAEEIGPGAVVTPKAALPLRTSPSAGLFGFKGDAIGTAAPTTRFRVIELRNISTVGGTQQWLKLQNVGDISQQGWVFSGIGDGRSNVALAR